MGHLAVAGPSHSHTLAPLPYTRTMENIVVEGEDKDVYACEASDTVLTLKEKIEAKEAFSLDSQYLYHEGYWLSEDDAVLSEFMASGEELTLTLPFASGGSRRFENAGNEDIWIIHGKRKDFERTLVPRRETNIKLKSDKFGIVYFEEGEEIGKKRYQVERYVVSNAETDKVVLTRSDGQITVRVGERLLDNVDTKVYDESNEIPRWEGAANGSRIAYYIGSFGTSIASLVFGVL